MNIIVLTVVTAASVAPAFADTYNYVCMDDGKNLPLKVDERQNRLEWKGTVYKIREIEECARSGWRAESSSASFNFCTATQGYADFQQNGVNIKCALKRNERSLSAPHNRNHP